MWPTNGWYYTNSYERHEWRCEKLHFLISFSLFLFVVGSFISNFYEPALILSSVGLVLFVLNLIGVVLEIMYTLYARKKYRDCPIQLNRNSKHP